MVEHQDLKIETPISKEKAVIIDNITSRREFCFSPIQGFKEFYSLTVPDNAQVGEMGSSRHNAAIFQFNYLDEENNIKSVPVIIKRMESFRLEHELKAYNRLSDLKTRFPRFKLAFYLDDGEGKSYFATAIESNILPLSSKIQTVFRESPNEKKLLENYEFCLGQGVLALLRLHRCGIKHKDAFPKNIGISTQNPDIFAYDFEHTILTEDISEPLNEEESMHEIERLFLARCLKYATTGDMTDGIFHSKEDRQQLERLKSEHRDLLDGFGITSPLVFINTQVKIMERVKELYSSGMFVKAGWDSKLEDEVHFKLTGKYSSVIYSDEFVADLIGNTGSLV